MPDYEPDYDPVDDFAPAGDPNAPLDPVEHAERYGLRTMEDLPFKDAHFEDPAADMSGNELRAGTGQVCPVCHRVIADGEPVRRRIDGTYQHDDC